MGYFGRHHTILPIVVEGNEALADCWWEFDSGNGSYRTSSGRTFNELPGPPPAPSHPEPVTAENEAAPLPKGFKLWQIVLRQ
jgi:hypothetical protein